MTASQASSVRFGRLDRRGLLVGLGAAQLGLLGTALVLVVGGGLTAGTAGVVLVMPACAVLAGFALVPVAGRPAIEVAPTVSGWLARRVTGRSRAVASPRPSATGTGGRVALPGVVGGLRIDSYHATGTAVLRRGGRRGGTVTLIAEVRGRGFLLADADTQDRQVAGWGRLLAAVAHLPGVTGAQVLHRTSPSGVQEMRRWWAAQRGPAVQQQTSGWAEAVVDTLLADLNTTDRIQTLVVVTLRSTSADIEAVLASMTTAVSSAELDLTGWLTPPQIRSVIRDAFDPGRRAELGGDPRGTGPIGVAEAWDHLRTDSGFHAVYWVSEWPRSEVHPSFLRPLLLAPGTHRSLSLLLTPLPTGRALREIRRTRAEQTADAMTRARLGRVEEEVHRAAAAELDRRETDLVAGRGDLRFVGLLTVTAGTREELDRQCAQVETAAAQAGCELRRLVGQQVPAFAAAALPIGQALP